ncbi:hypothetical protein [Methylotenera sp.]|uniref:hypothetical protein n=1 Tax=Methylotenera sp. TaxID=2051956 RepID=UPI002ED9CD00
MKILDLAINFISYLIGLWSNKSYDEFTNEHRSYERGILISSTMATIFILAASFLLPLVEVNPSEGIKYSTYIFCKTTSFFLYICGVLSTLSALWNFAELINFRYKNGME